MVRMMTYKETNDILDSSLTPNNRCICKSTALANDAQSGPLTPFASNRLVPVSKVLKNVLIIKYRIILLDENGNTIYDDYLNEGDRIPRPAHPAKEGYKPNGWKPKIPDTAQEDGTYQMQYKQKDDDAPGRENYAYTMDNQYQQYAPTKDTPTSPIGDISKGWIPTGGHWWYGPMDGEAEDTYGKDNGISAKLINGREYVTNNDTIFFTYSTLTDSCTYEYAKPEFEEDYTPKLLSSWSCPCYDGNTYLGEYTITSDCDWVKFMIIERDPAVDKILDIPIRFSVTYYVAENEGETRKGTVTVTTPGGTSHYVVKENYPQNNLPYITNAPTYFYLLGAND